MSVVSNASPIIFLGKINEVHLVSELFKGPYLIPSVVYREVLNSSDHEDEKNYLEHEFKRWEVKEVKVHSFIKGAGSLADWSVFELAHSVQPKVVLADDKFLRNILETRRLTPLGTLGILSLAVKKKVRTKERVIQCADLLIEKYNLWIDAFTYSRFTKSLR